MEVRHAVPPEFSHMLDTSWRTCPVKKIGEMMRDVLIEDNNHAALANLNSNSTAVLTSNGVRS